MSKIKHFKDYELNLKSSIHAIKSMNQAKKIRPLISTIELANALFESNYFMIRTLQDSLSISYYSYEYSRYDLNLEELIAHGCFLAEIEYSTKSSKPIRSHIIQLAKKDIREEKRRTLNYKPLKVGELPFGNGIFNALTKEFIEYSPDITNYDQMKVNYNPEAKVETGYGFKEYVSDFCGGNEQKIHLLYNILRTILFNPNSGKLFYIYGPSGDGKSTFFGDFFMKTVIGENNTSVLSLSQLNEPDKLVNLANTRMCFGDDNDGKLFIKKTGTLKTIATKGVLSLSRKYLDSITFECTPHMVQLVNSVPRFESNDGDALMRRTIALETNNQFDAKNTAIKSIKDVFTDEFAESAVLSLLDETDVPFYDRFDESDSKLFYDSMQSTDDVFEYIKDQINLDEDDLEKIFKFDAIPKKLIYGSYQKYCEEQQIDALNPKSFFVRSMKYISNLGYDFVDKRIMEQALESKFKFDLDKIDQTILDNSEISKTSKLNGYYVKKRESKLILKKENTINQITFKEWLGIWSDSLVSKKMIHQKKEIEIENKLEKSLEIPEENEIDYLNDELLKRNNRLDKIKKSLSNDQKDNTYLRNLFNELETVDTLSTQFITLMTEAEEYLN